MKILMDLGSSSQEEYWPLLIALIISLVGNIVMLICTWGSIKGNLLNQLHIKQIDNISQQLTEFYNPLYSMMMTNGILFEKLGPDSFPVDEDFRQAAGEVWNELKNKVILPNNKAMSKIFKEKSHLVSSDDDISNYLSLHTHIHMYEIFTDNPTERYSEYQFPNGMLDYIKGKRNSLVLKLNKFNKLDRSHL